MVGVNPGPVATDRMVKIMKRRAHRHPAATKAAGKNCSTSIPATARPAEEVADLVAFLASPKAGYISGTVVTIDGGIAARGSVI